MGLVTAARASLAVVLATGCYIKPNEAYRDAPGSTGTGPIQLVSSTEAPIDICPGTAAMCSIPVSVQPHDFLVAAVALNSSIATIQVVSDGGSTWHSTPGAVTTDGLCTVNQAQLFYLQVGDAAPTAVVFQEIGASKPFSIFILEYAHVAANSPLVVAHGTVPSTASEPVAITPELQVTASDLIVALFADANTTPMTPGNDYDSRGYDGGYTAMVEDQIAPTTGSYTPYVTTTGSNDCWVGVAAAFHAQ